MKTWKQAVAAALVSASLCALVTTADEPPVAPPLSRLGDRQWCC